MVWLVSPDSEEGEKRGRFVWWKGDWKKKVDGRDGRGDEGEERERVGGGRSLLTTWQLSEREKMK